MGSLRTVLAVAGLAIAFAAITAIAAGELAAVYRPSLHRIGRWIRPESVRIALAQAGLASIPVPAWIAARVTVAVAAATVGFDGDEHMPNGSTFTIGLLSMMFAASGPPAIVRFCGNTTSVLGAAPKLHCSVAPMHT